jgi:hypothetical protein
MTRLVACLAVSAALSCSAAAAQGACPRTTEFTALGSPLPSSDRWYGSEALAVQLPPNGVWPSTEPGAEAAVKVFWWSAGFRPGSESNLSVSIKELNGAPLSAIVSKATNARAEALGGWAMLTGIDFPAAGCWEITGRYLGQELTFVVETAASEPR